MEGLKKLPYALLGGIACALFALYELISMFRFFSVFTLLYFLIFAALAVFLFMKRRDTLLLAPVALLALLRIISFFIGFRGSYATSMHRFNFFCMLPALLQMLAILLLLFVMAVALTERFPDYRDVAERYYYSPAAIFVVGLVLGIIFFLLIRAFGNFWYAGFSYVRFPSLLFMLIEAFTMLALAGWAFFAAEGEEVVSDGTASADPAFTRSASGAAASGAASPGEKLRCGLGKHIVLLLITFGIWYLIWIYRVTDHLNCVEGEEKRTPVNQLLLCMFVPFYSIYWTYKSAQRLDKLAQSKGVPSDLATLCLILAIFVSIVPPIIMQDKLNDVFAVEDGAPAQYAAAPPQETLRSTPAAEPAPAAAQQGAAKDVMEELKGYKALLDDGVITQEDYDAKKKQLLGL